MIFFLILTNQIGGNLDSSVDIAPNQDVDVSVSISLGPGSALWEKREKIGVGEIKGSLGRGEGVRAWRVVRVACQLRTWFVNYAIDKRGGLRKR